MKTYRLRFIFSSGQEVIQEVKSDSAEAALRLVKDGDMHTFVDIDGALIQANMSKVDYVRVKEFAG